MEPRAQILRLKIKNPDPESEICDQELGFILHFVWTFLSFTLCLDKNFVIWKYLLQININANIDNFRYKYIWLYVYH